MEKAFSEFLFQALSKYSLPFLSLILIFIALWKPENFKLWISWLWQFLGYIFKFFRKKAIALNVEAKCSIAFKSISREVPEMQFPEMSIQWADENNIESFLAEGKAIIKLNFSDNTAKNIVSATVEYVKNAVLPKTRSYIDKELVTAIDFTIAKRILLSVPDYGKDSINYYIKENQIHDKATKQKIGVLQEIDEEGLFTRLVIRELDNFGDKVLGKLPTDDHNNEIYEFVNFVYNIVSRDIDDQTNLHFVKPHLNVSVILVAKAETYEKYGLSAYLRRIKLCLSQGTENFYLLARNDKVDILKSVAKELLDTGYFVVEHKPSEYKDSQNRDVLCYYIRINKESLLIKTTQDIISARENGTDVDGVITRVGKDFLKVEVNGIEGIVMRDQISSIEIKDAKAYFDIGDIISLRVLDTLDGGQILFSTKDTYSDPQKLLKSHLQIGKTVSGLVTYADDAFIKVQLEEFDIQGTAFRQDLTFSKYIFLHEKFAVGSRHEFTIKSFAFETGSVMLRLKDLRDPWESVVLKEGEVVSFTIMRRRPNGGFLGEIQEGVEAVLFKEDVDWFLPTLADSAVKFKLNSRIRCRIRKVNSERRFIILSNKYGENPYIEYLKNNRNAIKEIQVVSNGPSGLTGLVDEKYEVFVPRHLQSWDGKASTYIPGKVYKVAIKELGRDEDSFIGSFREVLPHPLQKFSSHFKVGDVIENLKVKHIMDSGIICEIRYGHFSYEAFLPKGEISDNGFIESIPKQLFANKTQFKAVLKEINLERNRIILSLKQIFRSNRKLIDGLNYRSVYNAIVLSKKRDGNYLVCLSEHYIEGILESSTQYAGGEEIQVRPTRINGNELLLTDN